MSMREQVARQDLDDAERRHERTAAAQREEAGILGADLGAARDECDRLRAQRDALLTALKDCTTSLDDAANLLDDELGSDYEGTVTEMRDEVFAAREVTAKVEAEP